jgi:hypothetical protein
MGTRCYGVALLVAGHLVACSGCGAEGKRRALGGSVTFQGQPLDQGSITFLTTVDPPGPVCGALIRAGRYEIPASQGLEPGTYRVAISSPVPGGTRSPAEVAAGASARARERIPPKYNSPSTLTVEITAGGTNRFDFDLE